MHSAENLDATIQPTGAGTAAASPTGRRPGRRPRLSPSQQEEVVRLYREATTSTADIRERFGIGDSSLYRLLQKHGVALRGRSPSASAGSRRSASPSSSTGRPTGGRPTGGRPTGGRRTGRRRAAARRAVKPSTVATATGPGRGTPAQNPSPRNNGSSHAFSVSFRAVRVVQARSPLEVVREVERLGATDIEEISRQ